VPEASDVLSVVVIRHYLLALGSCCLLGACGSKFSAAAGVGGMSGEFSGAGSAAAGTTSGGTMAGSGASGAASGGAPSAGDGGSAGDAGSTTDEGGTGGLVGSGGSSGNAGAGGGVEPPVIPQLGLALWLSADTGVQRVDGRVKAWLDQSGNKLDAGQLGENVRPEYVAKGLNDLPAIKFDGASQFLSVPRDHFGDFSKGLAGFMVLQPLASDCASAVELSNGPEVDDIAFGMWQNNWTYEVDSPLIQSGNVDLLAPSLYAVNHHPALGMVEAAADLRINGALLQSQHMPLPAMNPRENAFIGHTLYGSCNYFAGSISEIIVYQRVLLPAEVRAIESYLEQHWDLGGAATP
jgi:hypothetical protein